MIVVECLWFVYEGDIGVVIVVVVVFEVVCVEKEKDVFVCLVVDVW